MDLDFWVKVSALIGVPLIVVRLVFSYLSYRNDTKRTREDIGRIINKIETINETTSIHNRYQSPSIQLFNCTINPTKMNDSQIKRKYEQTAHEGKNDE